MSDSNKKPKTPIKDLKIAFVDTETTGLYPDTNEVIEMAAVIYDPNTDTVVEEWERKAAPRNIKTASDYALKINGYAEAPDTYKDPIKDVILEFNDVVAGCVIAGQNIQFDIDFINKYYKEFDIKAGFHRHRKLEISSLVWPVIRESDLSSLSLATLCEHFGISNEGEHRALPDCRRTLEVYRCVMKRFNS